ncbi:MAM domain-containing glycosylphosphatidylinositol anchor protein 2 [Plakobranchus ocellatus]|uniref:MAM domain-containing glycosylphosphatidylinositol anchor protein 2 n=1 Tax=Plakobranchus ocellatus TaxID=259542 RepID=A0AAV4C5P2_9GAST|nr:MAM domain-containing glycosylphosphatidylinositol anchor protein 2 [Plakobranchus ocellatus]
MMVSPDVFSCDFEHSCTFQQVGSDDFDWSVNSGETNTKLTGPNADHTKGNSSGRYIYIETSKFGSNGISPSKNEGDVAILRTPTIRVVPGCSYTLIFFYSMYGRKIGTLGVKMQGSTSYLWSKSGQQIFNGDIWLKTTLSLAILDDQSSFKLEFEGIRGDGYLGDIAIDDIKVQQKCGKKVY